jgi:histidinol dehydrogenase
MKTIVLPSKDKWDELCRRPVINQPELEDSVRNIVHDVKIFGDQALLDYSEKFDKIKPALLKVSQEELEDSKVKVSGEVKSAIDIARINIEIFHSAQLFTEPVVKTSEGVRCWRKSVAIEKVGLYIPGGGAPLFSTVLMLGIPAKIAGCDKIILCTPPDINGDVNPLILYTAGLLGITDIYKIGGAQAIAAMAYGTETIPKVFKIFGPGNQYVTKAKELVQLDGVAIDMPAGPSEVLIIADKSGNPQFIAADLLSQAEHGTDSQVILLTDSKNLLDRTAVEIEKQLNELPRKEIASKSLENSMFILLGSLDDCIGFSNNYAPEHLIINTIDFKSLSKRVINAGSVFIGQYSCESAGDYASGTNHTLPTNGYARSYSGVSCESFVKKITFQEVNERGLEIIGPAITKMAEAESLLAHKNAVNFRLIQVRNDRD